MERTAIAAIFSHRSSSHHNLDPFDPCAGSPGRRAHQVLGGSEDQWDTAVVVRGFRASNPRCLLHGKNVCVYPSSNL